MRVEKSPPYLLVRWWRKDFLNSLIIGPSWSAPVPWCQQKHFSRCHQHQKQILLQLPVSVSAMAEGGGQPGVIPRAKNLQSSSWKNNLWKWNSMFYFYSELSLRHRNSAEHLVPILCCFTKSENLTERNVLSFFWLERPHPPQQHIPDKGSLDSAYRASMKGYSLLSQ